MKIFQDISFHIFISEIVLLDEIFRIVCVETVLIVNKEFASQVT
jgi:hypothetical protein